MSATPADPISEAEVRLTAELSEIPLRPEELPRVTASLLTMLRHFEVISRVRVEEQDLHNPVENLRGLEGCREDMPRPEPLSPGPHSPAPTSTAPDFEDGYFFVPRIK